MLAEPHCQHSGHDDAAGSAATLSEAPAWITPALIDLTLRIWQPFYRKAQLTPADAVQILVDVGRLVGVLGGR